MKTLSTRQSKQRTALAQWREVRISGERPGQPKLFADTDYTAKLFNKNSGRLDIRSIAELYNFSVSELARMVNIEAKTAHKTPDSAAIHERLIPFEEVARTLALTKGSVSDFRRWLNASNTELDYRTPLQMIRDGQVRELAGIVRSALLGQSG
ncbi:MAG: antitoxin Xre/MbcA/ParS toxin-binding domain-containing protein [Chthoniobacterales bacterium]